MRLLLGILLHYLILFYCILILWSIVYLNYIDLSVVSPLTHAPRVGVGGLKLLYRWIFNLKVVVFKKYQ